MVDTLTCVSMVFGRGRAARSIADLCELTSEDRVVDVGCGPGAAVRLASPRCEQVTGVDPSSTMLRFGQWLNRLRGCSNVILLEGTAEALPLSDENATVVWALSSLHHWADRSAGIAEAHRVLRPGGRLLLAERLVEPGAHGHTAHGLTSDQADEVGVALTAAGFSGVHQRLRTAGHRTLIVVSGSRPLH
jgi:ubiquinone/menaquinone biosynthesis C-methylase UbiE